MSTHYIKITKPHFDNVLDGTKRAEIRNNDRGYQKGDNLVLEEVQATADGKGLEHTGRVIEAIATYVTNYMQKENVVVISIAMTKYHPDVLKESANESSPNANPESQQEHGGLGKSHLG